MLVLLLGGIEPKAILGNLMGHYRCFASLKTGYDSGPCSGCHEELPEPTWSGVLLLFCIPDRHSCIASVWD
ncbi:hypothetical protein G6F43_003319 [Rhizopus delemar]|nr:hypothetical protein G6F43_003319 [Rhizopus delemar]